MQGAAEKGAIIKINTNAVV